MLQAEAGCPKDDHHVNRSALVQSTTRSGQVSMCYRLTVCVHKQLLGTLCFNEDTVHAYSTYVFVCIIDNNSIHVVKVVYLTCGLANAILCTCGASNAISRNCT